VGVGRKAGVTKEETKAELLAAAARVFGERGFEGASISDITAVAGLSTGSVYAHFDGKADLFAAMLHAHTQLELDDVLGDGGQRGGEGLDVADLLTALGSKLGGRSAGEGALLVEAIVAAKRDTDVAALLTAHFRDRQHALARLIELGQAGGEIDPEASPADVARFSMMLALGSLLMRALDLPATDPDAWSALIARIVDGFRISLPPTTTTTEED
jgi:AcrR family transcriptional regulator